MTKDREEKIQVYVGDQKGLIPDFDGTMDELMEQSGEGCITLSCGCSVEPDGVCPCGNLSPLIQMGLIGTGA